MICAASAKAELRDLDHFDERLESLLVTTPAPSTSKKHKWLHSITNLLPLKRTLLSFAAHRLYINPNWSLIKEQKSYHNST